MTQAHVLVGQIAVILTVIASVWAVVIALIHRPLGTMLLGALVWVAIAVILAALVGGFTAVTVAPPEDGLHIVYGVLAVGLLPGAVLVGLGRPTEQRPIVAAAALIVLLILMFRLVQTGS